MKKLPLGIQNFKEIIEENHVYVDKTMYIHQLISNGKCFFLLDDYANICGVPVDDLELYFEDHIKNVSVSGNFAPNTDLRAGILFWYDGYSWDSKTKLLNPYGLLSFFFAKVFKSFWYVSGSPKFLIDLIKAKPSSIHELDNLRIYESTLDATDIKNLEIGSLLFQTGYLTVSKIVPSIIETGIPPAYILEMPNFEVKNAFFRQLTAAFTGKDHIFTENTYTQMQEALRKGDLQSVLKLLRSLFSSIPHQLHVNREAYYHSIFFAVMNVLGFKTDAEVSVSKGRIDAVLELKDKVYVFEFKHVNCPPEADDDEKRKISGKALELGMQQICARGYANKYIGCKKTIYLAAFAFLGRDNIEMLLNII